MALIAGRSRAIARRSAPEFPLFILPVHYGLPLPFGMLCIILTEPAHCGREVTVLDTLSMRLDCEDSATAILRYDACRLGANRPEKPVLLQGSLQGPAYTQDAVAANKKNTRYEELTA